MAKNADKYVYSGYGIKFDLRSEFSLGKNVILFGVDMRSSVHIDNEGKDIFIHGKGLTQGLDKTMFTAEVQYSINFSRSNKKSLHYNGSNRFLFVNATKIYHFKKKILK